MSFKDAMEVDSQGTLVVGEGMSKDWSRMLADVEVTFTRVGLWAGTREAGWSAGL